MLFLLIHTRIVFILFTAADCTTYRCNDGESLTFSSWVCDGEADCTNGEDEDNCNSVTPGMLQQHSPDCPNKNQALHACAKCLHCIQ